MRSGRIAAGHGLMFSWAVADGRWRPSATDLLGSSAGLFNDEVTARAALNYLEGAVQSKELRDCLNDYFRKQAKADVTFGDVSVGQLSFPRLDDRSSAWEIVVRVEAQGFSVTAYIDFVYIVQDNAL